jgi:hypothetical protein
MRRLLVLAASAVLLAGCSGADAQRAQQLLQQAQTAQQAVGSERLIARFDIEADGKTAQIAMQGGAYSKGPQAGDFYFTMTGAMPDGSTALDMLVEKRGSTVFLRTNGQTQQLTVPEAQQQLGSSFSDLSQLSDLERYVKAVSVSDTDLAGRPADRIVGTIDTQGLFSGVSGVSSKLLGDVGVHLGDVRVALTIPRDTHLVEAMVAEVSMSAQGHAAHLTMSLGVTDLNQPVDFPTV